MWSESRTLHLHHAPSLLPQREATRGCKDKNDRTASELCRPAVFTQISWAESPADIFPGALPPPHFNYITSVAPIFNVFLKTGRHPLPGGTMDAHTGMSSLCSLRLQVPPAPEPPEPSESLGLGSFWPAQPGTEPSWPKSFLFRWRRPALFPSPWDGCILRSGSVEAEVAFPSLKHKDPTRKFRSCWTGAHAPRPPGLPSLLRVHPKQVTPERLQWVGGRRWKP